MLNQYPSTSRLINAKVYMNYINILSSLISNLVSSSLTSQLCSLTSVLSYWMYYGMCVVFVCACARCHCNWLLYSFSIVTLFIQYAYLVLSIYLLYSFSICTLFFLYTHNSAESMSRLHCWCIILQCSVFVICAYLCLSIFICVCVYMYSGSGVLSLLYVHVYVYLSLHVFCVYMYV